MINPALRDRQLSSFSTDFFDFNFWMWEISTQFSSVSGGEVFACVKLLGGFGTDEGGNEFLLWLSKCAHLVVSNNLFITELGV